MSKLKTISHKLTQIDVFVRDNQYIARFTRKVNPYNSHVTWHVLTFPSTLHTWMNWVLKFGDPSKTNLMSGGTVYTWKIQT